MTDSDDIIGKLRDLKAFYHDWQIARLRVFGSVARGTARHDSDVDLLVEFTETPDLITFYGVKNQIQDRIGRKVDLITPGSMHTALSESILRDARDV